MIPGSGRSPGGGHGSPLQCSCLENPMDRGAWWSYSPWGTELDTTEATWHASTVGGPGVAWRGCWWSALPTPKAVLSAWGGGGGAQYPASPPTPVLAPALQKRQWCFWPLCVLLPRLCQDCASRQLILVLYSFLVLCCWRRCLSRRKHRSRCPRSQAHLTVINRLIHLQTNSVTSSTL